MQKGKRRDPLWELNSEANLWLAAFFCLNNSTLPELIIARMPKHTFTAGVGCRELKTSDKTQCVYGSTCKLQEREVSDWSWIRLYFSESRHRVEYFKKILWLYLAYPSGKEHMESVCKEWHKTGQGKRKERVLDGADWMWMAILAPSLPTNSGSPQSKGSCP